jgi:hypothetical protein
MEVPVDEYASDAVIEAPAPLVSWSGVWTGAVIGIAMMTLLTSLWLALSFSSHQHTFYGYLTWWIGGTAIASLFVAGLCAAIVSQLRGMSPGLMNAVTTWALLLIGITIGAVPGLVALGSSRQLAINGVSITVTTVSFWSVFWSMLIGLVAAVIGGAIGGMASWGAVRAASAPVERRRLARRHVGRPVAGH